MQHRQHRCFCLNVPHSAGKGSLGDLLSVNSVPRINPVPRIFRTRDVSDEQPETRTYINIDQIHKIIPHQQWDYPRTLSDLLEIQGLFCLLAQLYFSPCSILTNNINKLSTKRFKISMPKLFSKNRFASIFSKNFILDKQNLQMLQLEIKCT